MDPGLVAGVHPLFPVCSGWNRILNWCASERDGRARRRELSSSGERVAECDGVRVLEVAADWEPTCDFREAGTAAIELLREVVHGRLAFNSWIKCEDDFRDTGLPHPLH